MSEELSIFEEIDESLRVEKLERFWQRFGNLVIAGCALVVAFTAASVLWKNHQRETHMKETHILLRAQAMAQSGKYDDATALLAEVADGRSSMAALAKIAQANAMVKKEDWDKARAAYAQAAGDAHADTALRDFAVLQEAAIAANHHASSDTGKAGESGHPFALSLTEMQAAQLLEEGKNKEAETLLQPIAADPAAPKSQRARAMELLDMSGESAK